MKITHKKIKASIKIKRSKKIKASVDAGLQYWYLTKHGLDPRMMPPDAHLIDVVEDGWDTYVLLDRMLTTRELTYYDMEEKSPSNELIKGGCVIKGASRSSSEKIPAPFDKYYTLISDKEASEMMGGQPARPTPCEECEGYNIVSKGYLVPKNEYADALFNAGLDVVELISENGGEYFVGQVVNDRIVSLTPLEVESAIRDDFEYDDEFDSISSFDHSYDEVVPAIAKAFSVSEDIASIIYDWYDAEDAWDDFDSVADFISFIRDDIYDMAYACDDEYTCDKVLNAIEGCSNISSSTVTKVSEDDNSINYVVSDDAVPKFDNIEGADDLEEGEEQDDDFLNQPEQEFKSDGTAINGKQGKLPSALKAAKIPEGALVLDYGGGTVESEQVAQNYLDQFNATEMLYDPFNQTADHNRQIIKELRKANGADVAVCSNVLNVIKEADVRLDALDKIRRLLKPGADCYITVYEGSGSEGKSTQGGKSYQNNRKLGSYLEEIQQVFPDAYKKGSKVIVAPNTGSVSKDIEFATAVDINNIDDAALKSEIEEGIREYFASPQGGWPEDELDQAVKDYSKVEIRREDDALVVEVRAELSYEGMVNLSLILDPIVEQYDSNAYFDMVTGGIMEAYLYGPTEVSSSTAITGQDSDTDDYSDLNIQEVAELEDDAIYDDNEYMGDDIRLKLILDDDVHSDADGELEMLTENFIDNIYDRSTDEILEHTGITEGRMKGDLLELIAWYIPMQEGNYHIKADVTLAYDYDGYSVNDGYYKFNAEESSAEKPEVNPILSLPSESTEDAEIESATQVEGEPIVGISPEEENLNYAIENGLPFDINTFKEYKTDIDPNAVKAEEVEVGDVIDLEFSSEEVDLGTVVKVLAINDPAEPEYGDYSFKVEILQYPDNENYVGTERAIHFSEGDQVGYLIPV